MSCFIVEKVTIDRILSCLLLNKNQRRLAVIYEDANIHSLTGLGLKMLEMNCAAYKARYDESPAVDGYEFEYTEVSEIQALKSLQCFLYQCSEGDIEESILFKVFRKLEISWLGDIVDAMKEYAEAEWG